MPARIAIATAALISDGRVLLAHRHPRRCWYPDCWDLVGGHIEAEESAEEAIIRECREELAIDIRDPQPARLGFSDPTIDMHAFRVVRWAGTPVNAAPEEHDELAWFKLSELLQLKLADAANLPDIIRMIYADGP